MLAVQRPGFGWPGYDCNAQCRSDRRREKVGGWFGDRADSWKRARKLQVQMVAGSVSSLGQGRCDLDQGASDTRLQNYRSRMDMHHKRQK